MAERSIGRYSWQKGQNQGTQEQELEAARYSQAEGDRSSPSPAVSRSSTPGDSDPENNAALHTEELEARIEVFLVEAEEDLEMDNLPLVENTSPLPIPAPVFPGFIPFAVSTGQRCVPSKSLLRKVYHPYKDPVGRCRCEPGGWCDNLPCSGRK